MSSDTRTTFLLLLSAWNRLASNSGCLPRLILRVGPWSPVTRLEMGIPSRLLASSTARQSARERNVDLPLVRRSCKVA